MVPGLLPFSKRGKEVRRRRGLEAWCAAVPCHPWPGKWVAGVSEVELHATARAIHRRVRMIANESGEKGLSGSKRETLPEAKSHGEKSVPPPVTETKQAGFGRRFWCWLWCIGARERSVADVGEKLKASMRLTAKSRYNAAVRLQRQGKYAFFTTIVLSLGLIFLPLAQVSGLPLAFSVGVLNMVEVFLAVAVLVYSVVIGTARYELRAEVLTECGDKLKELIREMDREREAKGGVSPTLLGKYQTRYSDIVTDSENHTRSDYRLAILEMRQDHFITGFPRWWFVVSVILSRSMAYLLPTLMILGELIFIIDMLGATTILAPFLGGDRPT